MTTGGKDVMVIKDLHFYSIYDKMLLSVKKLGHPKHLSASGYRYVQRYLMYSAF